MFFKTFFTTFFILTINVIGGYSQNENPYEAYKLKWNNKVAPNFKATTIDGKEIEIKDLKDKVVLLNFWFTTCSGCKLEYKGLQTLKNRFENQEEVVFISIATDNADKLQQYLIKNPLNFEHIANGKLIADQEYNVLGYPTNILIDKKGVIRHIKIGGSTQSADDIEYEMKHLIKEI